MKKSRFVILAHSYTEQIGMRLIKYTVYKTKIQI